MNATSKSAKSLIAVSLLSVLALSSFVGAVNALIVDKTPAGASYVISEGMASTDNMVGSAATTGGASWQYSYDVNQFGCETGLISRCTGLPGYSASPVCAVSDTAGMCSTVKPAYALPPGTDVVFSADKSLRIAMNQYGEFISTKANTGQCLKSFTTCGVAGLAYGSDENGWQATESFASTRVQPRLDIQGWTFQMNFTHTGQHYAILAESIFGDFSMPESARGVWTWFTGDKCPGYGAGDPLTGSPPQHIAGVACFNPGDGSTQYYAGSLIPTGIQVLYDSQRLSVFRTSVTVYDGHFDEDVANVTLTAVYNKDSKTVIVYKDLKILLPTKVLDSIQALSFSERYELDLARNESPTNSVRAFSHYYHSVGLNQSTVYQHPLTGSRSYDVLNVFDAAYDVNFFAGYWPNATEYSVDSILIPGLTGSTGTGLIVGGAGPVQPCADFITCDASLPTGTAIHDAPPPTGEPSTPWVAVQWKYDQAEYPSMLYFLAKNNPQREIRFVEVLGLTDLNSGTGSGTNPYPSRDKQAPTTCTGFPVGKCPYGGKNQIGVEPQYLLQQVFNPESLDTINGQSSYANSCNDGATSYGAGDGQTLYNCDHPFLWVAVGQPSAAIDSAGAALLSPMQRNVAKNNADAIAYPVPFALFDRNSTGMQGSIPYGLCELPDMNSCTGTKGTYLLAHSNSGSGTGLDTTTYQSTFLQSFYDPNVETISQAQPIHGGCVSPPDEGGATWFMPAKSPITESWTNSTHTKGTCLANDLKATGGLLLSSSTELNTSVYSNQEGIITVGGPKANQLSRYFNDWNFAIDREGTTPFAYVSGGSATGTAPTNNPTLGTIDFFPISTWASSSPSPGAYGVSTWFKDTNNTVGFAVISLARDTIGTRGLSVYGWNGRDTYWASAWVSQWLGEANPDYNKPFSWLPPGIVSIILAINYKQSTKALSTWEPTSFAIVKALGTITELGFNPFLAGNGGSFDRASFNTLSTDWTAGTNPYGPAIDVANNVNLYSCSSRGPSTIHAVGFDWFSTKLPTCTGASVEFDGSG